MTFNGKRKGRSVKKIIGLICLWIRPLRPVDTPLPNVDLTGILLWFFVPFLGFSLVSTKLMWYVYPCIVPLCMLAAVFVATFLTTVLTEKHVAGFAGLLISLVLLAGTAVFVWNNYCDNVRGARSNDLQTFVQEQFSRDSDLAGSTIYLDAYDPFLYANTTDWEQNMQLLAMLSGDLDCQDGGAEAFLEVPEHALLILSIPFLQDHPELEAYTVLADNGQYMLISSVSK